MNGTPQKPCSIEGCTGFVSKKSARGWCSRHYQRWLGTGSPTGTRRPSPATRFFAKVSQDGECWRWNAAKDDHGYGMFHARCAEKSSHIQRAHRWAYRYLIAEIPDGLELDHLCRNRWCVNPWHLEPVTGLENGRRGESPWAKNGRKTQCKRGHALTPDNVYITRTGSRSCRACMDMHRKNYELRKAAKTA